MSPLREVIPSPAAGLDAASRSVAIRAGGLIFCSGMTAIDPRTGDRLPGTVGSETERIFENLALVLAAAGSSLARIVQIRAMLYDRAEYDTLNTTYRKYVPSGPPARTVWGVGIEAGLKVQLDVIAAM